MPTETLRPNAQGAECNIGFEDGCADCPNHFQCVDEVVADDDTTKIYSGGPWQRDLYNAQDSGVGAGTITSVTVWARIKDAAGGAYTWMRVGVKSGVTAEDSPSMGNAGSPNWVEVSHTWVTNPDTLAAWTWAEIDSMQIGVTTSAPAPREFAITQVWAVVDYETVPPLPTPARAENPLINRGLFRRHV